MAMTAANNGDGDEDSHPGGHQRQKGREQGHLVDRHMGANLPATRSRWGSGDRSGRPAW